MKTYIKILLLATIICFGCNSKYQEVKKGLPAVLFKTDDFFNQFDSSGNDGLALRVYENGTYSQFGYNFFAYGNWVWNEEKKTIKLNPITSKDSNFVQQFKVVRNKDEHFLVKKIIVQQGKSLVERNENAAIGLYVSTGKDPFAKSVNTWRIKPTKAETQQEIKLRTQKYLEFLLVYYEFVQENKLSFFTYGWYATPIRLHYGNGVRMAYENELVDWYSCFYNVDQATEAYKLLGGAMRKSRIKNIPSKVERNIDYVKQLIEGLK